MAKKSVDQLLIDLRAKPETLKVTLTKAYIDHEMYQLTWIVSETDKSARTDGLDITLKNDNDRTDAYFNSGLPAYMKTQSQFKTDLDAAIAAEKLASGFKSHRIIWAEEETENAEVVFESLVTNQLQAVTYGAYRESGNIILKAKKV
jgi:hypothetical protein